MLTRIRRPTASSTSDSVGMRWPPNASPFQAPTSYARNSSKVRLPGVPATPVVRSSVRSWKQTTSPSRVRLASSSMASAPSCTACSKASSVFSGAAAEAPRWAITSGAASNQSEVGFIRLQLDEVGLRRAVEQILVHLRLDVQVTRDIQQLVAHIARMRGAQLAIALDVPLLEQVGQSLVRVGDALALGHALEDAAVLFIARIADLDLVAQPSQKGLVHQVARRQVGREHDHHVERDFDLAPGVQRQKIEAVL